MPTDVNGDGRDDLILVNSQTGAAGNWLGLEDGSFVFNEVSGFDSNAPGHIFGVGDFNNDGLSDTLWRTSQGDLFVSTTFAGGAFFFDWSIGFVANVPIDWMVVRTGDFNGDGRDDILWRNATTGTVVDWLSNGDGTFASNDAHTGEVIPTNWHIVGTADFNGDGFDDILWRSENGTVTDWLGQADGGFTNNQGNTGQIIPMDWAIVATGDFNGDGFGDVLWRNYEGTVTDWLGQADGGFVNNHANTGQVVPYNWNIVGTGDYNGDGFDDVLWQSLTGTITYWAGQANGGFADNPIHAHYAFGNEWLVAPGLPGFGELPY